MSPLKGSGFGGALLVAAGATLISVTNVVTPAIYQDGGNAITYLMLRFAGFLVLCRLWFLWRRKATALPMRDRLMSYGVGTTYAAGAAGLLGAIAYLPVSLSVLIFYSFPLLTVLYSAVLDRRLPRPFQIFCCLMAFAGLALTLGVSDLVLHPTGLALAAWAAVAMAGAYVWNGRALGHQDSTRVTYHMSVAGLLFAAAVILASGRFALPAGGSTGAWALLAAVICFAGAFFGMFGGIRLIGAVRTATIMNLEPVITVALSVWFLAEALTGLQYLGAALVVTAVLLAQRAPVQSSSE